VKSCALSGGVKGHCAEVLGYNALDSVETQAQSSAEWLGREEWFEDPILAFLRNAAAIILNFDEKCVVLQLDGQRKCACVPHGVEAVFDQSGECLIQLTSKALKLR